MLRDRKNRLKRAGAVSENRMVNPTDLLILWLVEPGIQVLNAGDIVIEYHNHSGREHLIISSEEFKRSLKDESESTEPLDQLWLLVFSVKCDK